MSTFGVKELSVLCYANGFTLWHYKGCEQDMLAVKRPGFFDLAADLIASGDMILVSSAAGGTVLCAVTSGSRVAVAPLA